MRHGNPRKLSDHVEDNIKVLEICILHCWKAYKKTDFRTVFNYNMASLYENLEQIEFKKEIKRLRRLVVSHINNPPPPSSPSSSSGLAECCGPRSRPSWLPYSLSFIMTLFHVEFHKVIPKIGVLTSIYPSSSSRRGFRCHTLCTYIICINEQTSRTDGHSGL